MVSAVARRNTADLDFRWISEDGENVKDAITHSLLGRAVLKPRAKVFQIHDTRLKGFILRIQPTGIMTYFFEYRRSNGRKTRIRIGTTNDVGPTVARDRAKQLAADVVHGIDPAAAKREARANACTLDEYLAKHYEPWAGANTQFRTGKKSAERIRSVFSELLKKPITDPTFAWSIEKFRTRRMKDGIKKATVDRDTASLKAMFSHAVRNPLIKLTENPLKGLKLLRKQGEDDEGDERVRYLGQNDPEERKRFWDAIESREQRIRDERRRYNKWRNDRALEPYPNLDITPFADYLKPMIVLALHTGVRRRELFNLSWDNYKPNLAKPTLIVPGRFAKNKRTRTIDLNQTAKSALDRWQKQTGATTGLIFPSFNGGVRDNVNKAWDKLLEDAKISDFRWHDMRHDFASQLAMHGVDLNRIRELLGHRDIKTTLRYAHLSPEAKADAVRLLDRPLAFGPGAGAQTPQESV